LLLCAACGGRESYPDLSEVPARPQPTLTPEYSEEMVEEMRATREEAERYATEGRPAREGEAGDDVAGEDDEQSEEDDTSE
jgi:hypothetical protein